MVGPRWRGFDALNSAIRPDDFIPDPSGTSIDEMLGCFHKMIRPTHVVLEKIQQGIEILNKLAKG